MRFMTLYKPEKFTQPTAEDMARMGAFIAETQAAGILLAFDGVPVDGKTARVRLSGGKFTAVDGPFAEAKELIGGYALLQVKSKEQLFEVTRRFLEIAGDGECEVLQMSDGGPPPAA